MVSKQGKLIVYQADDGTATVDVRLEGETVWLSLGQLAELFGRDQSVISRHLRNIFKIGELNRSAVVAKNATTAADGKIYQVEFYNLDAVISVGYRVNSQRATQFRIWATRILKQYVLQGYAINEKRLLEAKNKFNQLQETISFLQKQKVIFEMKGKSVVIEDWKK